MDRPPRRPRRRTVALGVLALVVVTLFSTLVPIQANLYGTVLPAAFLLSAALCAAVLVVVTHPRVGIVLFGLSAFLLPLVSTPERVAEWPWPWSVPALITFAIFVAVTTFVHGWRTGLVPLVVSTVGALVAPLVLPAASTADGVAADLIVTTSVAGVAYLLAVLLSGRVRIGKELTREREVSAGEQSRRVLVEERTRIARELHDVVAHSMSVIQVQASTARYRVPGLPDDALAEFDDIAAASRGALTEMRRLLGVLRTEDEVAELAPQQGLRDIPALVDGLRRAGVGIALELAIDEAVRVPPTVQTAAFRIVQEALSNAVRHAPGAEVSVSVRIDAASVRLRVRNAGSPSSVVDGSGHGLRGMHERAAMLDGNLEAGRAADGGWNVVAVLPFSGLAPSTEEHP